MMHLCTVYPYCRDAMIWPITFLSLIRRKFLIVSWPFFHGPTFDGETAGSSSATPFSSPTPDAADNLDWSEGQPLTPVQLHRCGVISFFGFYFLFYNFINFFMHKNNILDWSGPKVNVYKGQKKKLGLKLKGGKNQSKVRFGIKNWHFPFKINMLWYKNENIPTIIAGWPHPVGLPSSLGPSPLTRNSWNCSSLG